MGRARRSTHERAARDHVDAAQGARPARPDRHGAGRGLPARDYMSERLRLKLSYAAFLVAAGLMVAVGVWIVIRTYPNYPLTAANPRDQSAVPTRAEVLDTVVKASAVVLTALAGIGLGGGWLLAGWILRPLDDINEA